VFSGGEQRAIVPISTPGGTVTAAIVRSANPQEYKGDGATIRAKGFSQHPVVHACIRTISDIVASVPLVAYREKGNRESILPSTHPLSQLLEFPGPRMTPRGFRARTVTDFVAYGNAMWKAERTGRRITSLRHINPESVQSVWVDAEGDAARYDYALWSGVITSAVSEDVLHFRDLELGRPAMPDVFGFPRGATAIQSLLADNEATGYVRQVVTNDGTPTFAIMLHDEATQEDANAVQARYVERMVSRGNRGKPAVFGGVKDIKPLGFTLADLEFPDLRRVSREDICAAFGVDPRMIGIASASSDGGLSGVQYREARVRLVQHTIEPLMAAIEDELNFWLAPEFGDVYIAFDPDILRAMVEDDETTSLRVEREFRAGLRSWQESRIALSLAPVPEPTDAILQTMGNQLIPAAVAVIDPSTILEPEPAAPTAAPEPEEPKEDEDESEESESESTDSESEDESEDDSEDESEDMDEERTMTRTETLSDPRYDYWQRAEAELTRRDAMWYKVARERFAEDAKFVARAFRTQGRNPATLDRILREIVAAYEEDGMLYEGWVRAFREVMGRGLVAGAQRVAGVGASWTIQSPEVLAAIEVGTRTLAGFVGEDTARSITAAMRAAEVGGFSVAETARLIQATVYGDQITDTRATRIARTENAKATNLGAWGQANEMGIYTRKEWIAFGDAKTREAHVAAMGQGVVPIDFGYVGESGATLQYPGDPSGDAADVINCRCVLGFYTDD
jgi:HK97 family phage portal protein